MRSWKGHGQKRLDPSDDFEQHGREEGRGSPSPSLGLFSFLPTCRKGTCSLVGWVGAGLRGLPDSGW